MPGVSIARQRGGLDSEAVAAALDSACFFDDYGVEWFLDGPDLAAAATGYDDYPVRTVEVDGATVVLEGHLYGVEAGDGASAGGTDASVEAHLRDVAEWIRADEVAELSSWVADRDGDFVVYVLDDETGEVAVLNDAFGRLPLFHARVGGTTVVSRELKVVREVAERAGDPVAIDRMGVAQTLLFGYRLGPRTLFSGVERVPPGSLLRFEGDGAEPEITRLHEFAFGSKPHADRGVEENATALASLFSESCRARAEVGEREGRETVLALSGGLDSRAVAAGFDAVGADFTTATFDRSDGSAADEVRAARAVAEALGVEWREYEASGSPSLRGTLLSTKQGMNDLRLSFLLDFLGSVGEGRGATYVTGDGGDKAFPDHTPPRSFADVDDLLRYVVSSNRIFAPGTAAEVAGVSEEALLETVRERLESYPESDLGARYVHFLIRERGMNWLFDGEDRNRYYHWSVSPFYSFPFFQYALSCPDDQKRGNELYRAFLAELDPAVLDVEYVNFGAPITSLEYRAKQFVYDALARHPELRSRAVDLLKRVKDDRTVAAPEVAAAIREQVRESDEVRRALSADGIERIVGDPAGHSEPAMYHLYTITSLVERCAAPAGGRAGADGARSDGAQVPGATR